jgi:adenosyl cobinamide kinase/adenosyl cobinamide phosphate guanylyltransferase
VGLSVHPETDVGRRFRDELGLLNQRLADVCDDVLLVVAGRILSLPKDNLE